VFLGRDGVINRYASSVSGAPSSAAEFELFPGVGQAIRTLNRLGLPVVVVSNQPGIARGEFTAMALDAINEKMRAALEREGARTDAVLYCRHDPLGQVEAYRVGCECRIPKPGMLLRAARERNLNLSASFLVGAVAEEILTGRAAGVTTILLAPQRAGGGENLSDYTARDLREAVQIIGELAAQAPRGLPAAWSAAPAQPDAEEAVLARPS